LPFSLFKAFIEVTRVLLFELDFLSYRSVICHWIGVKGLGKKLADWSSDKSLGKKLADWSIDEGLGKVLADWSSEHVENGSKDDHEYIHHEDKLGEEEDEDVFECEVAQDDAIFDQHGTEKVTSESNSGEGQQAEHAEGHHGQDDLRPKPER